MGKMPYMRLYRGFDVPDKGTDTYFLVAEVEFLHRLEERLYFVVFHYRDDTRVHLRPCVRATARVAVVRATPLHLLEESESPDVQQVEHILHALGIRLIEYYHD